MTIDLLLDRGVRLSSSCQITFGMPRGQLLDALGGETDVRDAFVCGTQWALSFMIGGITVTVSATTEAGVDAISFALTAPNADTTAVALDNVDLFGWPANEVVGALMEGGRDVHQLDPTNAWVDHRRVYLHTGTHGGGASTPRRKPRRAAIPRFDFACLYAPHNH